MRTFRSTHDHYHAALFALAARAEYKEAHQLNLYRGYNISSAPQSIDPADYDAKYDV